ncbi:hypothetical protein BH11BAC3_BH11BAC3_07570 [soil metagenome]
MSLFNFFRGSKQPQQSQANDVIISSSSVLPNNAGNVDASLFVDEQQPEIVQTTSKQENYIMEFLGQNFDWMGYNDGYSHSETDYMEIKLQLIRANFRLAIDKTMDIKRIELGELNIHVIKTKGVSERLELQLREKIKQLEITVHELDIQKILSVENEGMISSSIHAYRLGFVRGLEKLQEEKFFAGSTGLFN